tara:strand:- start:122 stop:400 length:279 start_codon:yes stop_codon:yes gene_type:complete
MCVPFLVSINPTIYGCNCDDDCIIDGDDYDDEDEVIIVFDEIQNTIKQIEENLSNGIDISSIFIFISKEDPDRDDVFDLLINIYSKINFIID